MRCFTGCIVASILSFAPVAVCSPVQVTPLSIAPVPLGDRPGMTIQAASISQRTARSISDNGLMALQGNATGPTPNDPARNGIFLASPNGSAMTVLLSGEPVPEVPGATVAQLPGDAVVSRDGRLLALTGVGQNVAVYGGTPGALSLKFLGQAEAFSEPGLNGLTAFTGRDSVGRPTLFTFEADSPLRVALQLGGVAPGVPGGTISSVGGTAARPFVSGRQVLATVAVRQGTQTFGGVCRLVEDLVVPVALGGTAIAEEPGFKLSSPVGRGISDDGTAFLTATAVPITVGNGLGEGLYQVRPGESMRRLVQENKPFDELPGWNVIDIGPAKVGRQGHLAVEMRLGESGTAGSVYHLLTRDGEAWDLLAREGAPMPGGGTFTTSSRLTANSLAVSDDGAVAFIGGNGLEERTALYIRDSGGAVHHLFSEGDTVSFSGIDTFTIPYNSFFESSIGPVVAGTAGEFAVNVAGRVLLVSVPEPATLLTLLLFAGVVRRGTRVR